MTPGPQLSSSMGDEQMSFDVRDGLPQRCRFLAGMAGRVILLLCLLACAGCSSSDENFVHTAASSGGGIQPAVPSSLEENVSVLSQILVSDGSAVPLKKVRASQVDGTLDGPAGGNATVTGDFEIGSSASNPASSVLNVEFSGFTFFDGLIFDGPATLSSSLWGTATATQGTLTLEAPNLNFGGIGSGTHNLIVQLTLVNSEVIRTMISLDGATEELGFIVKLVNKSSSDPSQVFITVTGKDAAETAWHYLADPDDDTMTEFDDTPATFLTRGSDGGFQGSDKYSLALSQLTPINSTTRLLILPRENLVSGRIFFSFGAKLRGVAIIAPYYNINGVPVTSPSSATGTLVAGDGQVTISGLDASQSVGINEPVSYTVNGTQTSAIVASIQNSSTITLSPAPTQSGNVQLSFVPDQGALDAAKLNLSLPSPTGSPDYLTTFDLIELSATTDTGQADPWYTLYANTTAIDFFSVGLGMSVNFAGVAPSSGSSQGVPPSRRTVGFGATEADVLNGVGMRDAVIGRFNNTGSPTPLTPSAFQNFVTAQASPQPQSGLDPHMTFGQPVDANLDVIRVLGPPQVTALQPSGAMATYLANTIATQWGPFSQAAGALVINFPNLGPYAFTYLGTTPSSATTLNLQCSFAAGTNTGQGEQYQLPAPTTRIVWECDDTDNPGPLPNNYTNQGSDAHKRLASIICAAFARGVFPNSGDWSDSTKFYTRSDQAYNFFSKVMHDFALNNVIYGFAYDDVYGQDSTISGPIGLTSGGTVPPSDTGNVVDVTLIIPSFTAPPAPTLPGAPLTVEARIGCGAPVSLAGSVIHFTTEDGSSDVNAILDDKGSAVVTGLQSNTTYVAWIAPGGSNASDWFFSYSARGKYDGTTGGTWSSSFGSSTPGVVRLQIGRLEPGIGSCLNPNPNAPVGTLPPAPVAGSGQANWGNLEP